MEDESNTKEIQGNILTSHDVGECCCYFPHGDSKARNVRTQWSSDMEQASEKVSSIITFPPTRVNLAVGRTDT